MSTRQITISSIHAEEDFSLRTALKFTRDEKWHEDCTQALFSRKDWAVLSSEEATFLAKEFDCPPEVITKISSQKNDRGHISLR